MDFQCARRTLVSSMAEPQAQSSQKQQREHPSGSLAFRIPLQVDEDDMHRATNHSGKKRRENTPSSSSDSLSNDDESSSGTDKSSANADGATRTSSSNNSSSRTASKKRWYLLQKDEKNVLENEIKRLQVHKKILLESPPGRITALAKQKRENEQLRRVLRDQQLLLARARSALTGYSISHGVPFEKYIHLGTEWGDRIASLAELKHQVLNDAEQFITSRLQFLDPTAKYSQIEKFAAPNGDPCFTCFDVIPLPRDFTSVKQVFDAIRLFFFNMEIKYTEESNELMVREDGYNDSDDQDIVTQRFVRSTSSGAQIESNSVVFSEFREADGDGSASEGDSAIFSVNFVNQDALYPYNPSKRLRQETTAAIMLKAYPSRRAKGRRQHQEDGSTVSPLSPPVTFVLTRAYSVRLRQSEVDLAPDAVDGMSFASSFCSDVLLKAVSETVVNSSSPGTNQHLAHSQEQSNTN